MRKIKLFLGVVMISISGLSTLKAQEAIPVTGGEASGSGGSASYSVGQVVYTTNTGTNGSLVQGVQHPYEISVVTGLEEAKSINLSVSVYPNPVNDYLILEIEASSTLNIQSMHYYLYDINGRPIENRKILDKRTTIEMSSLISATYFLRITERNRDIRTFKIIKKKQ